MKTENFTKAYPKINEEILNTGLITDSRNGKTSELLSYLTTVTNPAQMCTGGYGRKMNIFFLLAEAFWIWGGRKDVKYLEFFNSRMSEFSDDGKSFAAPYGYRLRHWGKYSFQDESQFSEIHMLNDGEDQIRTILQMLKADPETRRAVASIWNPDFDLGVQSKDLPCNDTLFFKLRQDKLHLTIANRSNDLHWGLPTNIFQFGFILRSMAKILGVGVGNQNHLSDSLHIYLDRPEAMDMQTNYDTREKDFNLYDYCEPASFHDGKITIEDYDWIVNSILINTEAAIVKIGSADVITTIPFHQAAYKMLKIYIQYKHNVSAGTGSEHTFDCRAVAIESLLNGKVLKNTDLLLLGLNFFMKNMDGVQRKCIRPLIAQHNHVHKEVIELLGKL